MTEEIKLECKEAKELQEGLNYGNITNIKERQITDKKKNETYTYIDITIKEKNNGQGFLIFFHPPTL